MKIRTLKVRDPPFETPVAAVFLNPLAHRFALRTALFASLGIDIAFKLGFDRSGCVGMQIGKVGLAGSAGFALKLFKFTLFLRRQRGRAGLVEIDVRPALETKYRSSGCGGDPEHGAGGGGTGDGMVVRSKKELNEDRHH